MMEKALTVTGPGKVARRREAPISERWMPRAPKASAEVFAEAMRLLAEARPKGLKRSAAVAYRIATAEVEEADLIVGVSDAIRYERFVTPAAVVEHCREARNVRVARERMERPPQWQLDAIEKRRRESEAARASSDGRLPL